MGIREAGIMKTTLDLPDEMVRRAKIAAVERDTTLRGLVGKALARELDLPEPSVPFRRRVTFPIFSSRAPGTLDLTHADLARVEAKEDIRRHGRAR